MGVLLYLWLTLNSFRKNGTISRGLFQITTFIGTSEKISFQRQHMHPCTLLSQNHRSVSMTTAVPASMVTTAFPPPATGNTSLLTA